MLKSTARWSVAACLAMAGSAFATQTFSTSGAAPADIQSTVDQFRAALGANNGVGGSFASGRREINWDGVPDSFANPNALPGNFFNPRGLSMTTPGTSLRVSADSNNPTNTPTRFTDIEPAIAGNFTPFSEERLFAPLGSNIVDVRFFIPGTNTPATVLGFGAIFTDVEIAGSTSFQFFDINDQPVGGVVAQTAPNAGLSFIGMIRDTPEVFRVRITLGAAIDSGNLNLDYVAMDDFIYGEPVPAPSGLAALAVAGLVAARRKRA
jgi:hypothetical protein